MQERPTGQIDDQGRQGTQPSVIYTSIGQVRSPSVLALHDYWQSKLRGRAKPAPGDIDPSEIRQLLPSIIIAEYLGEPVRVRYRLVGTQQVYYNGMDFTGLHLDEIDWGLENEFVRQVHDLVRTGARPVLGQYQWGFRDNMLGFAEFGAFPLSDDGLTVTRCIGLDDFLPFEAALGMQR
ncbi:MAG: PAS domain-containing protein [Dongiaceae bacterium]